ncbi:hypothetical protein BSKO_13954 [Bryopsis sp. KO-2023]|nr:hypothetical protein BSKO_13954 [Bryopsis sp. KO-2023]
MKNKRSKTTWDDGMILNVGVSSSSDEELEEIEEEEEEEDVEELELSTPEISDTEVNLGKRKAEDEDGGKITKKRKGKVAEQGNEEGRGSPSEISSKQEERLIVKPQDMYKGADEEEDINSAVRKLLAWDSQYVTDDWQTGAAKKEKKRDGRMKQKPADSPVEFEKPKRRGLEGWGNPREVDESEGFASLGIDEKISAGLNEMGYPKPLKVQRSMIPAFLTGRDMLVGSGVGTGKTLGYLAPMVHQLQAHEPRISRGEGTFGIILGASTESCTAIGEMANKLMRKFCWWLTCGVFVGSKNRTHEKARLRKGVTVVITTDTRLLDHLENTSAFKTQDLRWFIVDEAGHHLQSKRGNRLRCAVRLLEDRVQDSALMEGRQQNILTTSSMDAELGSLATWMLKRPLCVGLRPRMGKRFWDVVSVSGWGVKPYIPDPNAEDGNVYNQRFKN